MTTLRQIETDNINRMIMIRSEHNCNQANELDINIRSKKEICYLAVCTSPITITDRYHLKYIFLDCLRFFRILEIINNKHQFFLDMVTFESSVIFT